MESLFQQALAFHTRGDLGRAEPLYREILARVPGHFGALHMRGVLEGQKNNAEVAVDLINRAIAVNPGDADAHSNLGNALRRLKRPVEALAAYDRALQIRPGHSQALLNRGNALQELGRDEEAVASYDRAIAVDPCFPEAHYNRGNALRKLGRLDQALAGYERAIALQPRYLNAILNRGNTLRDLLRYEEAIACYDRVLQINPGYHEVWCNRGNLLRDLQRNEEALACFDRALELKRDSEDALCGRGQVLRILKRYEESARSFATLLGLSPDYSYAKGELLHAKMLCCDWEGLTELAQSIERDILSGKKAAEPFGFHAISRSARVLRRCTEIYAADRFPSSPVKVWNGERYRNEKIRIGYLSGEFYYHSILILLVDLFERHDRSRFELIAFDNGRDDKSVIRARFAAAFDEIVDINRMSDFEAAEAVKRRKVDILVNLNGYFGRMRQGVFALRASPVQVNYLGFPSTSGTDYMDYILADRHVIPPEDVLHYSEQVVYLPDCYQPNDSRRGIAERAPTRAEVGLPDQGFVFCCFNNTFKITPDIFDIWMRLLNRVPGSVLWLFEDNAGVPANLGREARARGVAPERLVYAKMIPLDQHLARHRLADLFLDTMPYNAHTTGSVSLWAGVPLLTCDGTTFPGRVAKSLLHAAGLPELVTGSLEDYEAAAIRLASDSHALAEIKDKLARNRATCPLFDTDRFRQHIESAYITMWERSQRGEQPAGFEVPTLF